MTETCKTCVFFLQSEDADAGHCRRYPPVVFATSCGVRQARPEVMNSDWCGEYTKLNVPPQLPAPQLAGNGVTQDHFPCCVMHWEHANRDDPFRQCRRPIITCRTCGNKRCPKASDCSLKCTNSNEPGQEGSIYK